MEAVKNKKDSHNIVLINRSFWPNYGVIGEALFRCLEILRDEGHRVSVIFQDRDDIYKNLEIAKRGFGITFHPILARTDSSSSIFKRVWDSLVFGFFVLFALIKAKPTKVYVSTDPPIFVPFVVMLYCKIFKACFVYHIQDIHPEAARVVVPIHNLIFKLLIKVDAYTMAKASRLITLTDQMAKVVFQRSKLTCKPVILSNPSQDFASLDSPTSRSLGFSFCGNAGRLQRIPLLLEAIKTYSIRGGKLTFTFAGSGVYESQIDLAACTYSNVKSLGLIQPADAAKVIASNVWALLPIEDEVTQFAFPSKLSSYVSLGANVLAICGKDTCVAEWVEQHQVGLVVSPELEELVAAFFAIEAGSIMCGVNGQGREMLKQRFDFNSFVMKLAKVIVE